MCIFIDNVQVAQGDLRISPSHTRTGSEISVNFIVQYTTVRVTLNLNCCTPQQIRALLHARIRCQAGKTHRTDVKEEGR